MAGNMLTQGDYNRAAVGRPTPGLDTHIKKIEQDKAEPAFVAPPVVTQEPEPTFLDGVDAAFDQNNWFMGAINSLEEKWHDVDLKYRAADHIDELMKGLPDSARGRIIGHRSLKGAQQERDLVLKGLADDALLEKMGYVGTGLKLVGALADPITLASGYGEVYAIANMSSKLSRLQKMGAVGLITGASTTAQAAALKSVSHTMDGEDVMYSGLFGLAVGPVIGAFAKTGAAREAAELVTERKNLAKSIMDDMDAKLHAETPMEYLTIEQAAEYVTPGNTVQDVLTKHKIEADLHNARIKELELKHSTAKAEYNSLHVPDEADSYLASEGAIPEFVNGIKGAYKQITQNDGSTLSMFVPWTGNTKKTVGQFSDLTDKMAKVEISDRDAVISDLSKLPSGGVFLSDVLDHPKLYKAHPELKHLTVLSTTKESSTYSPGEGIIRIFDRGDADANASTLLHEVQHAIQTDARFAQGGTPNNVDTPYWNLAGEEEARRTAKRKNLFDDVRQGDPYAGSDVQPNALVVKQFPKGRSAADVRGGTPVMASEDVLDAAGNVVPKARDLKSAAKALQDSGVFKQLSETKVGKTLMKLGFTDSSWLLSQKSPVAKLFSYELLENGAGIAGRTSTAAIQKYGHLKVMLSSFMPDLTASYKQYAHRNGISHWNLKKYYGEGMENWNKEIRVEMETRRNAWRDELEHVSTASKEIQDAADSLQRAADHALDVARSKGVRGFEDIAKQPGYAPLIWSGRALRKGEQAKPGFVASRERLLSEGYTNALGMTTADADKIAKAVIRRALHKDIGLDANPRALFSADSRDFLRQSLEEGTDLSQKNIDELFARIDARQGDKGMSSRAKRRTDIDLLVTDAEGNSLLDIVDNDLPTLFTRYSSEMSGRAALAAKGITSDADWTRLRNTLIEDAAEHGDDVEKLKKIIDTTYDQFLGRPAGGGVNKNARRLMDMASAAVLNQVGFAQMAEWAPIMAAHGIQGMFEVLPAVKAYRAALKAGTMTDDVLGELDVHLGRLVEEEMLFRPDIRLDDKLSDDPAWLRILDKGLGTANNVSGKLSLMHAIKSQQHSFVVAMQTNKVAKAVAKGEWSKLSQRFADAGWDEKFLKELQGVSKHFEFNERGTIQRLNMQEWKNPELTEVFLEGLHRHTNQMVQKQMIGETAYWMHPTVGAMLTQFRTFPLVAMEKQTARHMLMADEEAVFTAMYGLGLSALVYTAKVGLNAQGKGKDKQQYLDDRLSISAITKGAIQYANIAGPIQDVTNLAVAAGLAPKFMSSSNVGRTGGDKQANLSMSDIPSLGTGLKAFNAVTGMGKGLINPDYNYGKRDLQNVQGAIPLGNTPWLTIPWNAAKDAVE